MAGGSKIGRIVRSRKDREEITFTNYKGEEQTARFAPCGVVFMSKNDRGVMLSVLLDDGFTANKDEEYLNLYLDDGVSITGTPAPRGQQGKGKPAAKGRPERGRKQEEGDDEDF